MTHNTHFSNRSSCFTRLCLAWNPCRLRTTRQRFVFHTVGTALLLGVTLAYEPALGDGTTWTLPYTGSVAVDGSSDGRAAFEINNTSDHAVAAIRGISPMNSLTPPFTLLYGVEGRGSTGVFGSGTLGVKGEGDLNTLNGFGVQGIGGGTGVFGQATAFRPASAPSLEMQGVGVYGYAVIRQGSVGEAQGTGVVGVGGVTGISASGSTYGVAANANNYGVYSHVNGADRPANDGFMRGASVLGESVYYPGVIGTTSSRYDPAIYGLNDNAGTGVWGQSTLGYGVYGLTRRPEAAGVFGTNLNGGAGVIGLGNSTQSPTGYFRNDTGGSGTGLQGQCDAGTGVVGVGATGVYGTTTAQNGNAGYFNGNVQVTGTISGGAKNFKIDHPLDPAHKYLVHASVESSEQINIYRGNVTLDSDGKAIVEMPAWFEAENGDCSYNLTPIGDAAPNLHIAAKMQHNQFAIAGGKPGLEVSWQVTGIRQDAYAKHHPLQVEQEKTGNAVGKYLNPEDFGKSRAEGISAQTKLNVRTLRVSAPPTRFVMPPQLKTPPPPGMPQVSPATAPSRQIAPGSSPAR